MHQPPGQDNPASCLCGLVRDLPVVRSVRTSYQDDAVFSCSGTREKEHACMLSRIVGPMEIPPFILKQGD